MSEKNVRLCLEIKGWSQAYQFLQGNNIEQEIKDKHWKKEIVKVPDWPRKTSVAVFRLKV